MGSARCRLADPHALLLAGLERAVVAALPARHAEGARHPARVRRARCGRRAGGRRADDADLPPGTGAALHAGAAIPGCGPERDGAAGRGLPGAGRAGGAGRAAPPPDAGAARLGLGAVARPARAGPGRGAARLQPGPATRGPAHPAARDVGRLARPAAAQHQGVHTQVPELPGARRHRLDAGRHHRACGPGRRAGPAAGAAPGALGHRGDSAASRRVRGARGAGLHRRLHRAGRRPGRRRPPPGTAHACSRCASGTSMSPCGSAS